MIRKAVIVVLCLIALPSFAVSVISHRRPFETCIGRWREDHHLRIVAEGGWLTFHSDVAVFDIRTTAPPPFEEGPPGLSPGVKEHAVRYPGLSYVEMLLPLGESRSEYNLCGCRLTIGPEGRNTLQIRIVSVRLMPVSAILGIYPAIAFIRGPWRRHRRRRRGLCIRCGYNLEGNVSGVCSECGEAA